MLKLDRISDCFDSSRSTADVGLAARAAGDADSAQSAASGLNHLSATDCEKTRQAAYAAHWACRLGLQGEHAG